MNSPFSPSPPSRYTDDQLRQFRAAFAPQAMRYRSHGRVQVAIVVVGVILFIGQIYLGKSGDWGWLQGAVAGALFIVFVWHSMRRPTLECPACQRTIDVDVIGFHCPECGSAKGINSNWLIQRCCDACSKRIERDDEEGRSYRVHACTCCGVLLDKEGL